MSNTFEAGHAPADAALKSEFEFKVGPRPESSPESKLESRNRLKPKPVSDDDLYAAFENGTLDARIFDHEMHIRVGWIYVCRFPLAEAISRFADRLKAWATALGIPGKYHETITWFYMLIISDRQSRQQVSGFSDFLAKNTDLLGSIPSILEQYYKPETLAAPHARKYYVLPDQFKDMGKDIGE